MQAPNPTRIASPRSNEAGHVRVQQVDRPGAPVQAGERRASPGERQMLQQHAEEQHTKTQNQNAKILSVLQRRQASLEERMVAAEVARPKVDRRIAELTGNLKGLSDEIQSQFRRSDFLDEQLRDWRRSMGEDLRQKTSELDHSLQKVQSSARVMCTSLEDAQRKMDKKLKRIELDAGLQLQEHQDSRLTDMLAALLQEALRRQEEVPQLLALELDYVKASLGISETKLHEMQAATQDSAAVVDTTQDTSLVLQVRKMQFTRQQDLEKSMAVVVETFEQQLNNEHQHRQAGFADVEKELSSQRVSLAEVSHHIENLTSSFQSLEGQMRDHSSSIHHLDDCLSFHRGGLQELGDSPTTYKAAPPKLLVASGVQPRDWAYSRGIEGKWLGDLLEGAVSQKHANKLQSDVQRLSKELCGGDLDKYFPQAVFSYSTCHREVDGQGAGPGLVCMAALHKILLDKGIAIYSGLVIAVAFDWEVFKLRIAHRGEKVARVLVALLSTGFYNSIACLDEVCLAAENNIQIIPVRMEDETHLPSLSEQWPNARAQNMWVKVNKVQAALGNNSIPPRGSLLDNPSYIDDVVRAIQKEVDVEAKGIHSRAFLDKVGLHIDG